MIHDPDSLWRTALGWLFFLAAAWACCNGSIVPLGLYYPFPLLYFGIGLFIAVAGGQRLLNILRSALDRGPVPLAAGLFFLLGTSLSLWFLFDVFDGIPHTIDDIVYRFQSRVFLSGRLALHSHPLPEFFDYTFMLNDGRYFMLFQPLWPLVMAIGEVVGLGWLVNPILGGLSAALTYLLGRRTLGERSGRLGALILVFSPLFGGISATMLNHSLTLTLTLLGFHLAVIAWQDRKSWAAVLAGLVMGLLFTTRSLDALTTAPLVLGCIVFAVGAGRIRGRAALAALLAAGAVGSLQFLYNWIQTGHPLYFPQDEYFNMTEPVKNCHRLGFGSGVGCRIIHPMDYFPNGFTPSDAANVSQRRLFTFATTLYGWIGYFLLIPLGLGALWRRSAWRYWFFALLLTLMGGYFFFYYHGVWGRYYYSASPFLSLLLADTFLGLYGVLKTWGARRLPRVRHLIASLMPAMAFSLLALLTLTFTPSFASSIRWHGFGVDNGLEHELRRVKPTNAVVLIPPQHYGNGFLHQGADYATAPVIFANDFGDHVQNLVNLYPDRTFYSYSLPDRKLHKLDLQPDYHKTAILPAFKTPRVLTSGEYAGRIRINDFALEGQQPDYQAPIEWGLNLWGSDIGSYLEFRHPIFVAGRYRVTVEGGKSPAHCAMNVAVGGHAFPNEIGGYAPVPTAFRRVLTDVADLPRGEAVFRFTASSKDPRATGCFLTLFRVDLERVGPMPPGVPLEASPLPPLSAALKAQNGDGSLASPSAMYDDVYRLWMKYRVYYQPHFLLWLLLAVPLIWFVPLRGRRREVLILALSMAFIMWLWGVVYGLILLAVPTTVYVLLDRYRQRLLDDLNFRRWFLWIAVGGTSVLFFAMLLNETKKFPVMVVPLLHVAGIAYMLPKLIHVMVESARGKLGERDYVSYMVYFFFFPTWRLGPIERYPQFRQTLTEACATTARSREDLVYGLWRLGLAAAKSAAYFLFFKKFIFEHWTDYATLSWPEVVYGAGMGVFAVFLDFGGYADWSIGVSRLTGIKLSENFVRPFSSPNIGEWWRRWHMTLASWIKDYVYIPMGGSRSGNIYVTYMTSFMLVGMWHCFAWNFVIWGLLQGVGLAWLRTWKTFWYMVRNMPRRVPRPLLAVASPLQRLGDGFPRVRFVTAVIVTNWYFFMTALFFSNPAKIAFRLALNYVSFGLIPMDW